jgi:hypothetical protein
MLVKVPVKQSPAGNCAEIKDRENTLDFLVFRAL